MRVVVPKQGREAVLQVLHELHQGQPGISRMKSLATMYVWWPGLDKDTTWLYQVSRSIISTTPESVEMANKAMGLDYI